MFAPEGYAVFADVDAMFRRWSEDEFPYPGGWHDAGTQERRDWRRHDLRTKFFETCPSLSVASPTGQVMRVSSGLCEFVGKDRRDEMFEGYAFLDRAWTVRTAGADERIQGAAESFRTFIARIQSVPREGQEANPPKPLHLVSAVVNELVASRRAFAEFEGWALTCLMADVPSSPVSLDFRMGSGATARLEAERRGGRPDKQGEALAAMKRLFPDGRGAVTWKEVSSALEAEDVFIHPDTLRKAWANGGQNGPARI